VGTAVVLEGALTAGAFFAGATFAGAFLAGAFLMTFFTDFLTDFLVDFLIDFLTAFFADFLLLLGADFFALFLEGEIFAFFAIALTTKSHRTSPENFYLIGRRFLFSDCMSAIHSVVIIGSGPAGHTAAIYSARAGLSPAMYEGFMAGGVAAGGQLTTTTEVENFPGFPEGITGPELMDRMRTQSQKYGTTIFTETIERVDFSQRPFRIYSQNDPDTAILAHTVIIATGATAKTLPIGGFQDYWQKGISACAVCDGSLPIFKNVPLFVVGGGDSACEEATYLSKFGSRTYLVHRRDKLRASQIMQERVLKNPRIEILWNSEIVEAAGDGRKIGSVVVRNIASGETRKQDAGGLFFAIGHKPNTDVFKNILSMDEDGYLITKPNSTATNIEGVFAAGDVQDKKYRQAITAAGSGCMAALEAERFLAATGAH
jgi:thioredoxin reductase (NADPH)